MRYSISSRFRGTLLGAMLGEKVSRQVSTPLQSMQAATCLVPSMHSLIELGRFERDRWQEKLSSTALMPEFAALATLPLALFYHENELKLRQNLQASAKIWQNQPIIQESILTVGYAIAQTLSEKFKPNRLIPQILSFIETPQTDLSQKLTQVHALLTQGASLERTLTQLTPNEPSISASIALGLYCFLSSQEDFNLAVKRAQRLQPLASAIAGALSGAYNSAYSIPSWQITALGTHQTSTEKEVLQLSDSLVAVWSGVYDYEVHATELVTKAVVAAPRVIGSR